MRCLGGEMVEVVPCVNELFVGPKELLFVENELVVGAKKFVAGAKEERLEVGLRGKLASRGSEWTSARAVSRSCKERSVE